MIDKIEDLGLKEIFKELRQIQDLPARILKANELLDKVFKEKLGLDLTELKQPMLKHLVDHAEELSLELPNIVPFNKYDEIIEDNDGMTQWLKTEGSHPENWIFDGLAEDPKFPQLLCMSFVCLAADEGESLKGTVFVSKAGVIRHAFVQVS